MSFAWKVLVPLVLGLILWQMIALKLPGAVIDDATGEKSFVMVSGTTLRFWLVI